MEGGGYSGRVLVLGLCLDYMNTPNQKSSGYLVLGTLVIIALVAFAFIRNSPPATPSYVPPTQDQVDNESPSTTVDLPPVTTSTNVTTSCPTPSAQDLVTIKQKQQAIRERLGPRLIGTVEASNLLTLRDERKMMPGCNLFLHTFLYALPLHSSNGQVFAYDVEGTTFVVRVDGKTKEGLFLGRFTPVSYTGNSGADWYPVGVTKDDRSVVMYAAMKDPGAGGSNVSYGYALLPMKESTNSDMSLWKTRSEAPLITSDPKASADQNDEAFFYDDFSKVVFVTQGSKTPQCDQPCPINKAKLVWKDLVANKTVTVLEEPDTSYKLESVNVLNSSVTLTATTYKFAGSCVDLACASKKNTTRTIRLP